MANPQDKNKLNSHGQWYCTSDDNGDDEACIQCGLCYGTAPEFFAEDEDGNAYVIAQPQNDDELAACQEQLEECPTQSIGNDG